MRKQLTGKILAAGMLLLTPYAVQAQEKPKMNLGALVHTYGVAEQKGFSGSEGDAKAWDLGASLYRARIMMDVKLTDKDYLFFETDILSSAGLGADKEAVVRVLDAQYDHTFGDWIKVSAGKMLVSHNRNGLQTASTLMANDFTYYQYPYNMSQSGPLQNDCGRDVGLNFSGGKKLKYRLGAFSGRRDFDNADNSKTLRYIGRVEYNIKDIDLYSGTNLGEGETFTIAGGFDTQGTYLAAGGDVYVDMPMGAGSITANAAYSYITGGEAGNGSDFDFSSLIPTQNVTFLELGYYFPESKIQPWIKYESQAMSDVDVTNNVFGGGINYFFNGYGTNVRLSYVAKNTVIGSESNTYGQVMLQLQLCLF